MAATAIVTQIITILVSGITGVAEGVGAGLSTLATSIFLTGTGADTSISAFGVIVVSFAAISLALGLCRWTVNLITSFGQRNR